MDRLPNSGYLLDQLLHCSLDSIYFKDTQSRIVMSNEACAKRHGVNSPEEEIGKTDFDIFSDEHAKQAYADEQQIIKTGNVLRNVEEKETWPDGHVTWVSTTKAPIRDDDGNILGILGITRDITEHKKAELYTEHYQQEISAIKEMLEEDARVANRLQQGFFKSRFPAFPEGATPDEACIEFVHQFHKSNLVSGDSCSIQRLSATKVAILQCHILGSGTRSALATALIRGIMQQIAPVAENPAAYITRLNEHLYPLLHTDHLLLDVTACYMVLDVSTGIVQTVSAGHPQPLHFRKGQPVKWLFENLVMRGPALAVHPHSTFYAVKTRLRPTDSVLLFSDGLFSVTNTHDEPFCEQRLLRTAQEYAEKPLKQIFQGLEQTVLEFSAEGHFTDDVCMVGFQLRNLMEYT